MEFVSRTLAAEPGRWKNVVLVGGSEGGALAARVARARSDITHLIVVGDGGWSMRDNLSSLMGADVVEAAWKDIAQHPDSAEGYGAVIRTVTGSIRSITRPWSTISPWGFR